MCVCVIEDFALLEAGYVVVRVLQAFPDIVPVGGGGDGVGGRTAGSGLAAGGGEEIGSERQLITLVISAMDGCWVKASRSRSSAE